MLSGEIAKEKKMKNTTISIRENEVSVSDKLKARILAIAFGTGIIFLVGFSHSTTVHNAAHDIRHTLGFPCH